MGTKKTSIFKRGIDRADKIERWLCNICSSRGAWFSIEDTNLYVGITNLEIVIDGKHFEIDLNSTSVKAAIAIIEKLLYGNLEDRIAYIQSVSEQR